MKKETIVYSCSDRCINIVAGEVESLRINNDLTNTVRVYDGGNIGVEGKLGNADLDQLTQAATAKLAQSIAYPETHDQPLVMHVDATKPIFDPHDFVPATAKLLKRLSEENPDFLFNNKVQLNSSQTHYTNSDGTDLLYKGNQYLISLSIKYKGSANIMDEFYGCESDYFDEDQIAADVKQQCDAFLNKLPQIEEDEVTVIGDIEPLQYAVQHLLAEMYFNNASIFNGKLGQKVFSDKFSLLIDTDPSRQINLNFFDAEGVVNKDFTHYLVEDGVLKRLITCKKTAAMYNTENLGSASAPYNGVPTLGAAGFTVKKTPKTLAELASGKALYLSVTSGGDMTPSGDVAMPALVAYLVEDGKLVGRLPEFTVTANLFDIFGDGYIGTTEHGFYTFGRHSYCVYKAKLVNKKTEF